MRRGRAERPKDWLVTRDPSGATFLRLPDGRVQAYTEDQLAGMVVDIVVQSATDPASVSEEYLEALSHVVGPDRWAEAMGVMALVLS